MRLSVCLLFLLSAPGLLWAQALEPFYGDYYPANQPDWPCAEDGAILGYNLLTIRDGMLYGLENTCALSNPRPGADGVRFDALCRGEGLVDREEITLTNVPGGVAVTNFGVTSIWKNCTERADGITPGGGWRVTSRGAMTYAGTRDHQGNVIKFQCEYGRNGRVQVSINGAAVNNGSLIFDVDGRRFHFQIRDGGGIVHSDTRASAARFVALWEAVAAGSRLTILPEQGPQASFSLAGSRSALGRTPCIPEFGPLQ